MVTDIAQSTELPNRVVARRRSRMMITSWVPAVLLPTALLLWIWAVRSIDMAAVNDYGLVSVLPSRIWVALLLLIVSFAVCWRRADRFGALLALHVVLFIVLFYGIPAAATGIPRGPIVYRHAGIVDTLVRTGVVDTAEDAYFNWPGFFMGLGWTVKIGGLSSALALGTWASVAVNLFYFPPLLMVLRAFTRNAQLIWAAVLLFFVTNWVNQDYLAPQSFSYIFYLMVLALVLHYLGPLHPTDALVLSASTVNGAGDGVGGDEHRSRWTRSRALLRDIRRAPTPKGVPSTAVGGRSGVLVTLMVLILFTATVATHQLTPYALFFSVTVLAVTGYCRVRGLPLLMAVILATWTIFVASGYIDGHLVKITQGSGITTSADANLAGRLAGSEQHLIIVWERVALTASVWLLALAGAIRRFRTGHRDYAAALLALAPVPLFLLPYGGEVLLRLYFFMLPFVAFFAAALFVQDGPKRGGAGGTTSGRVRRGVRDIVLFGTVTSILMVGSLIARYGNERMDYYTPGETAAIQELYRLAPPGSYLLAEVGYLPWRYQDYEWNPDDPNLGGNRYLLLTQEADDNPNMSAQDLAVWTAGVLGSNAAAQRQPGFLIVTRSQRAHAEILGGIDTSTLVEYERIIAQSNKFRLAYSNEDAKIYARVQGR